MSEAFDKFPPLLKKSRSLAGWKRSFTTALTKNWDLTILIAPVIVYFTIFRYLPMFGVQIAFKDFIGPRGIMGSPWVGFKHFRQFFQSVYFIRLIRNTVGISLYQLVAGFPMPIILALIVNELRQGAYKKVVQTVTYAPYFLSTVVLVGMMVVFLSPRNGIINIALVRLGLQSISFMTRPRWFKSLYVWSGVWQTAGWGSIVYIAALANVDPELHESAVMDGANRLQRIWHINVPGLLPTAVVLLILNFGRVMSVGFEKIYLMQNDLNLEASDVIATYVYRMGIIGAQYSFTAAVGLFNSVINFGLLLLVNSIARRLSDVALW